MEEERGVFHSKFKRKAWLLLIFFNEGSLDTL